VFTLTVTGRRGERSFAPVDTNGSQRGGRPIVQFLPQRIGGAEVLEGGEWSPLVTDDFILVPNPGKGERLQVKFRARPPAQSAPPRAP
jgi:zinc protease